MIHVTQLQDLLGLDDLALDTRMLLELLVAVAVLLYAVAVRRRKTGLRAWPLAMMGLGLVIDLAVPILGRNRFAYVVDTTAIVLFMCGAVRVGLELVDAVTH